LSAQDSPETLKDKAILYIKSHVITRSLKPISGNSVNAILSRAEMNLNSGNLEQALVELEPLSKIFKNSNGKLVVRGTGEST
jgi:hypothetical protein